MNKTSIAFIAAAIIFVFSLSTAQAAGIGIYGSLGSGSGDWEDDGFSSTYSRFSTDETHRGAGFVVDSNLAGDELFNYHLNLGYEIVSISDLVVDPGSYWSPGTAITTDTDVKGIMMTHSFGFGGKIFPGTRLWLGPELRLQWGKGTPDKAPDVSVKMFGVGVGAAAGLNFNLPRVTIGLKAGYDLVVYNADVEGRIDATHTVDQSYELDEKVFYVNLEFMFRSRWDK